MSDELKQRQRFHPGEFIEDEMRSRNWDIEDLARKSGLNEDRLRPIIDGRDRVLNVDAIGLSNAFGTSYMLWINLQSSFDRGHK